MTKPFPPLKKKTMTKLLRIEISSVSGQSLHACPRHVALVGHVHANSQLARHMNSTIAECKCHGRGPYAHTLFEQSFVPQIRLSIQPFTL